MKIFSSTLILIGAGFMLISIVLSRKMRKSMPEELQKKWLIMIYLMVFFFAAYIGFVIILLNKILFPLELVIGSVFLGGAFFVFTVVDLSRSAIWKLREKEADISKINGQLSMKNASLEQEINRRTLVEDALQKANEALESKVEERTYTLNALNEQLMAELSERQMTERKVQRANEFIRTVLDSMNDAISIVDVRNHTIIDVNGVFLQEVGLRREDVIGKRCHEIIHHSAHPCSLPNNRCPLIDMMKNAEHSVAEHIHFDEYGKKIFVEVSTSPVKDDCGNIIYAVHACRNITPRKLAEETLRKNQEELLKKHEELSALFEQVELAKREWETVMDHIGDMVICTDDRGNVQRCNKAFKELTGKTYEELIGINLEALLSEYGIKTPLCCEQGVETFHEKTGRWLTLNVVSAHTNPPYSFS